MTPQDHNKVLGIMHLIHGGFNALMMVFLTIFFVLVGGAAGASAQPGEAAQIRLVFGLVAVLSAFFFLILGLLPVIAGYGLLKRKSWARTVGIVAAILAAFNFPFGTALAVYSLWFFFGAGKSFYESPQLGASWRGALHDAPPLGWEAQTSSSRRQHEYVPPPQPPNWRDG